jgi:Velvet factor
MVSAPGSSGDTRERRRLLCGNLVSMAQILEDPQGLSGLFFIFSDVSIRWRGRFQLGITLMKLSRRVHMLE